MIQLPHKLSELAQIAVDDIRSVEMRRDVYRVNMGQWHRPQSGVCALCAAGAVMACRLDVPDREDIEAPSFAERFGVHNGNALLAVDELRTGCVGAAIASLTGGYDVWRNIHITHELDREIISYDDDRAQWFLEMNELIADLKQAGL